MQGFLPLGESLRDKWEPSRLRVGDWVQVRSQEEILATLDAQGRLDGMPFMPEMLAWCGRTVRVASRAHKTCDTICQSGGRKLERMVHLADSRCNGSAHGGCEAACLLFWNECWLEPAGAQGEDVQLPPARSARGCSMEELLAATEAGGDPEKGPRYRCQSTDLLNASRPLSAYNLRQYIEDWRSGNAGLGTMLRGLLYVVAHFVVRAAGYVGRRIGLDNALAKPLMACYDALQRLLPDGVPYPRRMGTVPKGQPTPHADIGPIRPGTRVRVKSYPEILATLSADNRTRGLHFDGEHVPYCGKEYTVRSLVSRIIDESTGYMLHFKTPSIILESATCRGTYSDNRLFCPRSIYHYWRPIWLKPVDGDRAEKGAAPSEDHVA